MYEQLRGASGRRIYFRAPRVKASWIAGNEQALVRFGGHDARLCDLSLSGMLVDLGSASVAPEFVGAEPVEVSVAGDVLYRGTGVPVRVESRARTSRVGIKLLESPADPHQLRRRARESQATKSLSAGATVYEAVPPPYRREILEATLTLTHWRNLLDQREAELQAEPECDAVHLLAELETCAEERLRAEWAAARRNAVDASEAIAPDDARAIRAAKRATELMLTPILSAGRIWAHAYAKPRGYPGDFELMNLMYETRRRGDTVFERIVHQLGVEERLAATVRTRKDFLAAQIAAAGRGKSSRSRTVFSVTNLGAGPARELVDVVKNWRRSTALVVTLIDQDEGALEVADRALRLAAGRLTGDVEIRCRHVAFADLLRDRRLLAEVADQDMVYSAGLFDYLPDRVATDLVAALFGLLAPGGHLLVGNAIDARDVKWVPEYVLDWHMIYRDRAQMLSLAKQVQASSPPCILVDESAAWQFLSLHRDGPDGQQSV